MVEEPSLDDIISIFIKTNGNKKKTGEILGISRSKVYRKLKANGIENLLDILEISKKSKVKIIGNTSKSKNNGNEIIDNLISIQAEKENRIKASRNQKVIIQDEEPFVIALFSDLHLGNTKTNYSALKDDTISVKECPFCYCITAGDYTDNWIGNLGYIAREQEITKGSENELVKWWFSEISNSLIACCAGNHDNRSIIMAGIDYIQEITNCAVMLYDQDQILFDLKTPKTEVTFKVRHKDQYKSILNPFHGAFRDIERGDCDWDIYISGHDHKATLFGDYIHHDKAKLVCRIGTYKMDDRFGKFLGFARSYGIGSGALVIMPDGTIERFKKIKNAIEYAKVLRNKT